jgi:hypothetical protein
MHLEILVIAFHIVVGGFLFSSARSACSSCRT